MALYTFRCRTCKGEKEIIRNIGDFTEPLCPSCSNNPEVQGEDEKMEKIIGRVGGRPIFKGTGFYETDYVKHEDRKKFYEHEARKNMKSDWKFDSNMGRMENQKTGKTRAIHYENDKDRYVEKQKKHNKKLDKRNKK